MPVIVLQTEHRALRRSASGAVRGGREPRPRRDTTRARHTPTRSRDWAYRSQSQSLRTLLAQSKRTPPTPTETRATVSSLSRQCIQHFVEPSSTGCDDQRPDCPNTFAIKDHRTHILRKVGRGYGYDHGHHYHAQ